jgi:hypothetical protein
MSPLRVLVGLPIPWVVTAHHSRLCCLRGQLADELDTEAPPAAVEHVEAERLEAAELYGDVPAEVAAKPRRKNGARSPVGPLRPVTDDIAVARASRMRRGWEPTFDGFANLVDGFAFEHLRALAAQARAVVDAVATSDPFAIQRALDLAVVIIELDQRASATAPERESGT